MRRRPEMMLFFVPYVLFVTVCVLNVILGVQTWKPFSAAVIFLGPYIMLSNVVPACSNPLNASRTNAKQRYITLANIL